MEKRSNGMYIPGDDNVHLAEIENILSRLAETGGVEVIGAREERVGE